MIFASYKNPWGVNKFKVQRINTKTLTLTSDDKKFPYKSVSVKIHECKLSFERVKRSTAKAIELLEAMPFHIRIEAAPYYLEEADLLYFLRDQAEELTKQFNFETHMIESAADIAMGMVSDETMEETGYHSVDDLVCDIDPNP